MSGVFPRTGIGGASTMQELGSIGGPKEATLYLACCYYYMQMFDKVNRRL